jgi:hypothetical protein
MTRRHNPRDPLDISAASGTLQLPGKSRPMALNDLVHEVERLQGVEKADLKCGDLVMVHTRNSSYAIFCLGDGRYRVSGGWFDRTGASPATTTINGCTWGGSAIKTDLVAGRGLFLEFGNHVVTTRIQQVQVIRADEPTAIH